MFYRHSAKIKKFKKGKFPEPLSIVSLFKKGNENSAGKIKDLATNIQTDVGDASPRNHRHETPTSAENSQIRKAE